MDKKCEFVAKYFMLALKLFTVVFKRSDRRISSDDTERVDLFVMASIAVAFSRCNFSLILSSKPIKRKQLNE